MKESLEDIEGDDAPVKPVVSARQDAKPVRSRSSKKSSLPEQIVGSKYIRSLEKVVGDLRNDSESHGNRKLFLDDVFIVYLLAFFNPAIRSLRTLEDLSRTPNAQKHLSVQAVCRSTLSDFNKLVDPQRLQPIVDALRSQLQSMSVGNRAREPELADLLKQVVAVDGTFLPAMASVAWAVANSNNHGSHGYRARVDARIDIHTWLPEAIVVPEPGQSEAACAIEHIESNKIYIYDRGFMSYDLLRAHYEVHNSSSEGLSPRAHFVLRIKKEGKNSPTLINAVEHELTDQQRAAGIVSDRTGFIQSGQAQKAGMATIPLREVVIHYQENGETKTLRIITNLLDIDAETIGLIYRCRWQVELFFRWLKSIANFNHLISHTKQGTTAQLYVTIIGVMVMYIHSAYRPSKYTLALLGQVAMGACDLEDILPILRERERRCELDRVSAAKRRAKKQS